MRGEETTRLVWCLGMYASGSTWLFNAARAVAETLQPSRRVSGVFAETLRPIKTLQGKSLPADLNVIKTHELPEDAAAHLAAQADIILVSLRDPRDAVTSLTQHMGESFPQALRRVEASARAAARHAADPRTRLFVYESGFTEAETTFPALAAALGGTLTPDQARALFTAFRRSEIEEKIFRLTQAPTAWRNPATGDIVDKDTQWHRHHAGRDGATGRWRQHLTAAEAGEIEHRLEDFLQDFGYARTAAPR